MHRKEATDSTLTKIHVTSIYRDLGIGPRVLIIGGMLISRVQIHDSTTTNSTHIIITDKTANSNCSTYHFFPPHITIFRVLLIQLSGSLDPLQLMLPDLLLHYLSTHHCTTKWTHYMQLWSTVSWYMKMAVYCKQAWYINSQLVVGALIAA